MSGFDRKEWAGRIFKCTKTGEVFVIPDDVRARDFFSFGESFVDVGDGWYARFGGYPVEIDKDGNLALHPDNKG